MGRHILLAHTHIGVIIDGMPEITEERSVPPVWPIQIGRGVPIIDREHDPSLETMADVFHPIQRLEIDLCPIPLRPTGIEVPHAMSEKIRGQRPETLHKPPVMIVHAELFDLSISALDSVDWHRIDQFVAEHQTRDAPWPQFVQTVDPREEVRLVDEGL
jgi:hypothetical protein